MKIAVEGCAHGELDRIYEVLGKAEEKENIKIDLLICCGDFQAVRDSGDLNCMAVPVKYRHMQTFYKYYSGEKKAPILTIFIGGNHEASNHLWELGFGGWVAPNIYYLGNAGVVKYGGLRIAGLSGIYKEHDYIKNHFERPPYDQSTIRSTYHVRSCDVFRMKQLSGKFDIMLSHDWPLGIYDYGDRNLLIKLKPHFAEDMGMNCLGNPPAMELLQLHRPSFWFSAHLHVKFAAVYYHTYPTTPHNHALPQTTTTAQTEVPPTKPEIIKDESENKELETDTNTAKELGTETDSVKEPGTSMDADIESGTNMDTDKEPGSSTETDKEPGTSMETDKEPGSSMETDKTAESDVKSSPDNINSGESNIKGQSTEVSAQTSIEDPPILSDCADGYMSLITPSGEDVSAVSSVQSTETPVYTKFLALDKPLPRKRFLQILDVQGEEEKTPYQLEYDSEWLAVLKSTESLMKYSEGAWIPPHSGDRQKFTPTEEELKDVEERFAVEGCGERLVIPENFEVTVPAYVDGTGIDYNAVTVARENPQTTKFCEKLNIPNPFKPRESDTPTTMTVPGSTVNPDEIDLDDDVETDCCKGSFGDEPVIRALVLPPPINVTNEVITEKAVNVAEGKVGEEEAVEQETSDESQVTTTAGIKRALPISPTAVSHDSGEGSHDLGVESSTSASGGPCIKRRNIAIYNQEAEEDEET